MLAENSVNRIHGKVSEVNNTPMTSEETTGLEW